MINIKNHNVYLVKDGATILVYKCSNCNIFIYKFTYNDNYGLAELFDEKTNTYFLHGVKHLLYCEEYIIKNILE